MDTVFWLAGLRTLIAYVALKSLRPEGIQLRYWIS